MSLPQFAIGLDIGGTKIKAGAVDAQAPSAQARIISSQQIPTPRAHPSDFYDAIASLITQIRHDAESQRVALLPVVSVAHPGRFLPDGSLARSTTPNLGLTPDEFDGLKPAEEIRRRVGGQVHAENDAIAQMRFGLDALLRDPATAGLLRGETVVYLGPGTGMGGGVARISAHGEVEVITDGHLFDLEVAGVGDGTLTAEELFTGPSIARRVEAANAGLLEPIQPARAGQLSITLQQPSSSAEHRRIALEIAAEQAQILVALIDTVRSGRIVKVRLERRPDGSVARARNEPDRAWPQADQDAVRGVTRFILGGFVGTDRYFGAAVREDALRRLAQRGLGEIRILQIPVDSADAGLLGIITAIPKKYLVLSGD